MSDNEDFTAVNYFAPVWTLVFTIACWFGIRALAKEIHKFESLTPLDDIKKEIIAAINAKNASTKEQDISDTKAMTSRVTLAIIFNWVMILLVWLLFSFFLFRSKTSGPGKWFGQDTVGGVLKSTGIELLIILAFGALWRLFPAAIFTLPSGKFHYMFLNYLTEIAEKHQKKSNNIKELTKKVKSAITGTYIGTVVMALIFHSLYWIIFVPKTVATPAE